MVPEPDFANSNFGRMLRLQFCTYSVLLIAPDNDVTRPTTAVVELREDSVKHGFRAAHSAEEPNAERFRGLTSVRTARAAGREHDRRGPIR